MGWRRVSDHVVVPIVDEGVGNSSYVVDLGDGRALAVDATRDLRALRADVEGRGLEVAFAADSHLHADFLSGARDLAAQGAELLASAAGRRQFPHTGLQDGDEVDLGGLTLRTLATPGHTDEHLAFLLLDGDRPLGVFTGGSLLVGAAARTDLSGAERTDELSRAQWRSLQRLATLPDETAVWPTHGAGSFCSAPAGADRTSTIGREKANNALLRLSDEDAFVAELARRLGSFPPYFLRLPQENRRGPRLLSGAPSLAPIAVADVAAALQAGVQVIDVRTVEAFAAGHVPGSLSIPLRPVFATWLGWLALPDRPMLFVRDADQDPDEIVWQAMKIGYENLAGELAGGFGAWLTAGRSVARTTLLTAGSVSGRTVLDVRQDSEYASGHLPHAVHVELGGVRSAADDLPAGPMAVMCGHGERAMTAASLLEQAGHRDLGVVVGGPDEWARSVGEPLRTGP